MDPQTERKLIRTIVRQVHPDLFGAFPYERTKNSDALKILNVYADSLSQGLRPEPAQVNFYVRQQEGEEGLVQVTTLLQLKTFDGCMPRQLQRQRQQQAQGRGDGRQQFGKFGAA